MRVLFAFVLLVPAAHAGSIPLAEFRWSQPYQVTLPAQYMAVMRMYDGRQTFENWQETVTAFPHTSHADQQTVDDFNRVLNLAENGEFIFFNGGIDGPHASNGALCGFCQFYFLIGEGKDQWASQIAASGWQAQMFVPRLGPHLVGYWITDIERTITSTSQTITLHGLAIPEPGCWLLVLCCCVWHVRRPLAR